MTITNDWKLKNKTHRELLPYNILSNCDNKDAHFTSFYASTCYSGYSVVTLPLFPSLSIQKTKNNTTNVCVCRQVKVLNANQVPVIDLFGKNGRKLDRLRKPVLNIYTHYCRGHYHHTISYFQCKSIGQLQDSTICHVPLLHVSSV